MQIETYGQQMDVTPALRSYVETRFERLGRRIDHDCEIRVQLALEKPNHKAIATVYLSGRTLHSDATVGQPKVISARDALTRINPYIAITPVNALLDDSEIHALITEHDLVLDCTDNVSIRNQLNAGCYAARVPLVSGAAIRMEGQITVFTYQEGEPCYRCLSRLFGENALTCVEAGVMAPLIGVIGSLQAMEAIKLLANYGKPASGKIVMYDAMTCQFREMKLMRNPGCEVCSR